MTFLKSFDRDDIFRLTFNWLWCKRQLSSLIGDMSDYQLFLESRQSVIELADLRIKTRQQKLSIPFRRD